jgi:hypothetical protein
MQGAYATILCYAIATWSGFFVMAIELLGARLLAPTFGSSIYVWGALITVFMLALSIGYLAGGRYSVRNPSQRKLGTILLIAALTVLPTVAWSEILLEMIAAAMPDPRYGSLVAAMVLFFVPTALSGMVSPYAVRLLVRDRANAGRHAGQLYFASTFGSAAGTLLTSFYLVLWLELNQILFAMITTSAVLGSLAMFPAGQNPDLES